MPDRRYSVIEIFGPTIQGEGPHAGRVVAFIRLGGCDYRCSWCDSLHAVEPAQVRRNATKMTAAEIVAELPPCDTVILSGGNPALVDGTQLASAIRSSRRQFHVETQGTAWKTWLGLASLLVVSPKPPSSGMADKAIEDGPRFVRDWRRAGRPAPLVLKFVVADERDLAWALEVRDEADPVHELPFYLSALTPPDCSLEELAASYRRLCDMVLTSDRARIADPVVLPQLHVVAWGHALGV